MSDIEGYIKMRNAQELDNNWLWRHYKENGGTLNDPNEFLNNFYFEEMPIIVNGHKVGAQKTNKDLSSFFSDMDRKFGLTTLWGKDGSFIKVVE
jgi:hypothetical protein